MKWRFHQSKRAKIDRAATQQDDPEQWRRHDPGEQRRE
jgi:hypothetical protein